MGIERRIPTKVLSEILLLLCVQPIAFQNSSRSRARTSVYYPCSPNSDHYNEELSSLVHCSSCHIRHLTPHNREIEAAHNITKVLTGVERLCILESPMASKYAPRLLRDIAKSGGICVRNLQVLQMSRCSRYFEDSVSAASRLFKARNQKSRLAPAISGGVHHSRD